MEVASISFTELPMRMLLVKGSAERSRVIMVQPRSMFAGTRQARPSLWLKMGFKRAVRKSWFFIKVQRRGPSQISPIGWCINIILALKKMKEKMNMWCPKFSISHRNKQRLMIIFQSLKNWIQWHLKLVQEPPKQLLQIHLDQRNQFSVPMLGMIAHPMGLHRYVATFLMPCLKS